MKKPPLSKAEVFSPNRKVESSIGSGVVMVVKNGLNDVSSNKKATNSAKKPKILAKNERKKGRLKEKVSFDDDLKIDNGDEVVGDCRSAADENTENPSFVNCLENCLLDEIDDQTFKDQQQQDLSYENTTSLSVLGNISYDKTKKPIKTEIGE
jgi:hypothetical protein